MSRWGQTTLRGHASARLRANSCRNQRVGVDPKWYESFFETDEWLLLATAHDPERAEREVAFLTQRLPAGGSVLDLACGTGRISVPLSQHGYVVSGIDISQRALEVARREGPGLEFRHGDLRELPWPDESFDGVINLWTAFGYYETADEDERALGEVARVLRQGGVFIIDTVNTSGLHRGFRPEGWRELGDGTVMLERRVFDLPTGRAQAYWSFLKDGTRKELSFDHRLYSPAEYALMLRGAKLEPKGWYGGFDGSELTLDSFRLLIVAERV
jgi:SAM-dependent methyltransferase